MTWPVRHRLSKGLRRLGHRPRWQRGGEPGFYVYCKDCAWEWGGAANHGRRDVTRRCAGRAYARGGAAE